jgi:hypothetical protein
MSPSRTVSKIYRACRLLLPLLWSVCSSSVLGADEVYKSVDAHGKTIYSDHPDSETAERVTLQVEQSPSPPPVIHFCWTNCFTLMLDNGLYRRQDGSDETWTIVQFTPPSVILRRHDAPASWNGFSADVAYQGQVSGDRLVNVTVDGKPVSGIAMAWGAALDTLPGSNDERDLRSPARSTASQRPAEAVEPSTKEAPPLLADDDQPPCPAQGYLWNPGYWAWSGRRYTWVTGIWVLPPRAGLLWTPGYWEFAGEIYVFHPGYWASRVGYYGGINYGFGYFGIGFVGGRWVDNSFAYNTAVTHVNPSVIHNRYSETAINSFSRVSYNGGPGGTTAVPTPQQRAIAVEAHIPPTSFQLQHRSTSGTRKSASETKHDVASPAASAVNRPHASARRSTAPATESAARASATSSTTGADAAASSRSESAAHSQRIAK